MTEAPASLWRERLRSDRREGHADRLDDVEPGPATVVNAEGTISEVAGRVWRLLGR